MNQRNAALAAVAVSLTLVVIGTTMWYLKKRNWTLTGQLGTDQNEDDTYPNRRLFHNGHCWWTAYDVLTSVCAYGVITENMIVAVAPAFQPN
ncbi:hypothetical protein GJ496_000003 [Pomphorhynchus laevis]|nr:hypothetical protein GJ496_000003 [Pomphorhynchus laevis]